MRLLGYAAGSSNPLIHTGGVLALHGTVQNRKNGVLLKSPVAFRKGDSYAVFTHTVVDIAGYRIPEGTHIGHCTCVDEYGPADGDKVLYHVLDVALDDLFEFPGFPA